MTGRTRCGLAMTGLVLWSLLATTAWLRPDERGMGTHEQLGLGSCTLWSFTGVRCPTCGMTTAWSWLTHGQPRRAVATHVVGSLLGVAAAVGGGWMLATALAGSWKFGRPTEKQLWVLVGLIVAALAVEWGIRCLVETQGA